jgi:hypothetical protein
MAAAALRVAALVVLLTAGLAMSMEDSIGAKFRGLPPLLRRSPPLHPALFITGEDALGGATAAGSTQNSASARLDALLASLSTQGAGEEVTEVGGDDTGSSAKLERILDVERSRQAHEAGEKGALRQVQRELRSAHVAPNLGHNSSLGVERSSHGGHEQ